MELLNLIVSILLLSVQTVPYAESRFIFDHIKNIFDPVRHENTPAKVINSFLSPFRGSSEVEGPDYDISTGGDHGTSKAWWDNTSETPLIQNIFNQPPTTKPTNGQIITRHDSEPTDILDKIKEMKDKEKANGSDSGTTDTPTQSTDSVEPTTDGNQSVEQKTEDITPDGKKIMHAITKKHFYFQAQAVRPAGSYNNSNETIYYVDE